MTNPKGRPMTSSIRSWFLVLAPLVLAAVLTLHPQPTGTVVYDGLRDHVTPWLVVHVALLPGACLMALVVHQLLRGLNGRAATVSRIALIPFVVGFVAWEGTTGIGTGLLVHDANALPPGPGLEAASADIQDHFTNPVIGDPSVIGMLANTAWIVAVIAAGIAVRRAGAGIAAVLLLCLASLFTVHAMFVGSIGLACLAGAALLVERTLRPSAPALFIGVGSAQGGHRLQRAADGRARG